MKSWIEERGDECTSIVNRSSCTELGLCGSGRLDHAGYGTTRTEQTHNHRNSVYTDAHTQTSGTSTDMGGQTMLKEQHRTMATSNSGKPLAKASTDTYILKHAATAIVGGRNLVRRCLLRLLHVERAQPHFLRDRRRRLQSMPHHQR